MLKFNIWEICPSCGKILIGGEMKWLNLAAHHILKILVTRKITIISHPCDKCVRFISLLEIKSNNKV